MLGKSTDGPVSRYINRRISTRITGFIIRHHIPITPNQVTFMCFLLCVLSSVSYVYGYLILAGIIVQLASILDGVDGELARATNQTSDLGAFMDSMLDRISDVIIISGMSIYVLRTHGYTVFIELVIMFALSGALLVSYIHAAGRAFLKVHPLTVGRIPSIASRDVRLFIIFIGSVLGFVLETLLIVAVLSYLYSIAKTVEIATNYSLIMTLRKRN